MSDLAKLIAEETSDARHFNLYGFQEWRRAIEGLLELDIEADYVEILMTSDFPLWGADPLLRKYSTRQNLSKGELFADYIQSIGVPLIKKILK